MLRALLSDPVRFGMLFQLLFVNLVVTGPGIWVAFNLEAVRAGDAAWERAIAVGHWHVPATLSAAIGFLMVVDRRGVRGWPRQLTGWGVLVGSTVAFTAVQFYMFRPPGTAPAHAVILALDAGVSFPTALQMLSAEEWLAIRAQEPEIGYAYVEPGDRWPPQGLPVAPASAPLPPPEPKAAAPTPLPETRALASVLLHLDTGTLSPEEVNLILNALPVEITYVDENDAVRYFNKPRERTFLRPPAVIGRKVQKCHPPASLHRVQRILDDFRAGKRDVAEFWIQMQGRFIHIRYFPLWDERGAYRGALEVVQDVTDIRALEGERRLLDESVPDSRSL
ncbi:MAG: PAS domain-containing protein [Anaerolineae bacterium]